MKDCKFKQLILDVYSEWNKPERVFKKNEFGVEYTYKNFWGEIFGAISRDTFDNIKDIDKYMDICNPNMLCIHSRETKQELEIYDWRLKDYRIEGDNFIINLNNKEEIFKM